MFKDKLLGFLFLCTLLLGTACNERTSDGRTTEVTYLLDRNEPSPMFWDYAASTNMLQTELSQLAQQKASDSMLISIADSVYQTHSRALHKLRNIAEKYKNVQLPDSLTGADKAVVEEFSGLEKDEFKARYLEYLQRSNASQLSRYQETLSETEDPALRLWLNTIRVRLQNQAQLYSSIDTISEAE